MHRIDDLTAEQLGTWLERRVDSFTAERLTGGFMSDTFRLTLAPGGDTVVLKLGSDRVLEVAERFGSHAREARFYREIAEYLPLRVPRCHHVSESPFVLLLEDLSHLEHPDLATGLTQQMTGLAITALATLHQVSVKQLVSFHDSFDAAIPDMQGFVSGQLAQRPDSRAIRLMRRYAADPSAFHDRYLASPMVLSHMDFRSANLCFTPAEAAVLDWGEYGLAPTGFDLANLFATSITTEQRRSWEQDLLQSYASQRNLDPETVFNSYRDCLLPVMYLPAFAVEQGDSSNGDLMWRRCLAAIEDHQEYLARTAG